jgi:hypothetical protein
MGLPEGADLMTTPISPAEKHYLNYTIQTKILNNGTVQATYKIEAEGQSDSTFRRMLSGKLRTQQPAVIDRELIKIHPLIQVSNLTYSNPDDISKPFAVTFTATIPNYLQRGKNRSYLQPLSTRLPFADAQFFTKVNLLENRTYPFRTRCSQLLRIQETITLPVDMVTDQLPAFKDISGTAVEFKGSAQKQSGRFILQRELKLKKRIYQPAEWDNFKAGIKEFTSLERDQIILKKRG